MDGWMGPGRLGKGQEACGLGDTVELLGDWGTGWMGERPGCTYP